MKDCQQFENAEEVWFWFCKCMAARADGVLRSRTDYAGVVRNCEVNDIYCIIKKMKQEQQISGRHLRVMMEWGQLECPPYYDKRAKNSEIRLWDYAMKIFESNLRNKRIIKNEN